MSRNLRKSAIVSRKDLAGRAVIVFVLLVLVSVLQIDCRIALTHHDV